MIERWMGLEIVFVQVGHGLLGAAALGLVASQTPWWLTLAIAPLIAFSLAFWLIESSFVLPVARRLIAGDGAEVERQEDGTATTRPRGR